jgi:hypothetical protein
MFPAGRIDDDSTGGLLGGLNHVGGSVRKSY